MYFSIGFCQVNGFKAVVAGKKTDAEKKFVKNVRRLLYFFMKCVETKDEETHTKSVLRRYVSEAKVTSNPDRMVSSTLADNTHLWLESSFYPRLPLLCFRHFMYKPYGAKTDNHHVESENSSLKRDEAGAKGYHKILNAADAQIGHDQSRHMDRMKKHENDIQWSQETYKGDDPEKGITRSLEGKIVGRSSDLVCKECLKSSNYMFHLYSQTSEVQVFMVRLKNIRYPKDSTSPLPLLLRTRYDDFVRLLGRQI